MVLCTRCGTRLPQNDSALCPWCEVALLRTEVPKLRSDLSIERGRVEGMAEAAGWQT